MKLRIRSSVGVKAAGVSTVTVTPEGLLILPALYAVVPIGLKTSLPNSIPPLDASLGSLYQYALRNSREGYVYVFYEDHPTSSDHQWDIYYANKKGLLELIDVNNLQQGDLPSMGVQSEAIQIAKPESQGTVWLAFSEHPWSYKTLKAIENDDDGLRSRRMQAFDPKQWVASHQSDYALIANADNIKHIVEYSGNVQDISLLSGLAVNQISIEEKGKDPDGSYNHEELEKYFSRYPVKAATNDAAALAKTLQPAQDSQQNQPALFALHDHVGIVHELNGFRSSASGWIEKYQKERELQLHALEAIDAAKEAFKESIRDGLDKRHQRVKRYYIARKNRFIISRSEYDRAMKNAKNEHYYIQTFPPYEGELFYIPPNAPVKELEGVDLSDYGSSHIEVLLPDNHPFIQRRDKRLESFTNQHNKNIDHEVEHLFANRWGDYAAPDYLNIRLMETFRINYQSFLSQATKLSDLRAGALLTWLESPLLLDALSEYHDESIADGNNFCGVVGDAIDGISSSHNGMLLIDKWVKECKVGYTNLVWRSMAYNQKKGVVSVNAILAVAKANIATPLSSESLMFANLTLRLNMERLLKLTGASLDLVANRVTKHPNLKPHILEKIYSTVGQRFLVPFLSKTMDPLSIHVMEGIFASHAGVEYQKLADATQRELVNAEARARNIKQAWKAEVQAQQAKVERAKQKFKSGPQKQSLKEKLLYWTSGSESIFHKNQRLYTAAQVVEQKLLSQKGLHEQNRAWSMERIREAFQKDKAGATSKLEGLKPEVYNKKDPASGLARTRLSWATIVLQGAGVGMTLAALAQSEDDEEIAHLQGILWMVGLSLAGTSFDLAGRLISKPAEALGKTGANGKLLRAVGNSFNAFSGGIFAFMDYGEAKKQAALGETKLVWFYGLRFFISTAGAIASLIDAVALLSPWLTEKASERFVARIAAKAATWAASRIFLGLVPGLGIAVLVLEVVLIYIRDDELQNWCERCAFGPLDSDGKPDYPRYSLTQQKDEFEKAIAAVLT